MALGCSTGWSGNAPSALRSARLHNAVPHAVGDIALRPATEYEDKQDHGTKSSSSARNTKREPIGQQTRRAEDLRRDVTSRDSDKGLEKATCRLARYARLQITGALYYYIFRVFELSWRCFFTLGHHITFHQGGNIRAIKDGTWKPITGIRKFQLERRQDIRGRGRKPRRGFRTPGEQPADMLTTLR